MRSEVPSNENTEKAYWAYVQQWAENISDEQILETVFQKEADIQLTEWKASQKGISYVNKRVLHTSKERNVEYALRVWPLSTPEILRLASVREESWVHEISFYFIELR